MMRNFNGRKIINKEIKSRKRGWKKIILAIVVTFLIVFYGIILPTTDLDDKMSRLADKWEAVVELMEQEKE